MSKWQYIKGLHDLGRSCFAYLQPDGSWGWSNAGLVVDGDQTLLIDTLFDLPLTAEMLTTMRDAVPAARTIQKLINTHANGDHTFGNQLVKSAEIIACRACAEEYAEAPPAAFAARAAAWQLAGDGGAFFQEIMGSRFDWRGLIDTPPTILFDKTMEVTVGSKRLVLNSSGLGAHPRRRSCPCAGRSYSLHRRLTVRRRSSGDLVGPDRKLDQGLRLHFEPRRRHPRTGPRADR